MEDVTGTTGAAAPAKATTPAAVVATAPKPSSYQEVIAVIEKAFAVAAPFETLLGSQVDKLMTDLSVVVTDLGAL